MPKIDFPPTTSPFGAPHDGDLVKLPSY